MSIYGIQGYVCTYIGHQDKEVMGFCLNKNCQTFTFCFDCAIKTHQHDGHKDDCLKFEDIVQIFEQFKEEHYQDSHFVRQLKQKLVNYIGQVNKLHSCDIIKTHLGNLSNLLNVYFGEISEREKNSFELLNFLKNSEYEIIKNDVKRIKEHYNFIKYQHKQWLNVFKVIENSYEQLFNSFTITKEAAQIADEINSCLVFCNCVKQKQYSEYFNQQNLDIYRTYALFTTIQIKENLKNCLKHINLQIEKLQGQLQTIITNIIVQCPLMKYEKQLRGKQFLSSFLNSQLQLGGTMKLNQQFSNFYYLKFRNHSQLRDKHRIKFKCKFIQQFLYFDIIFELNQDPNLKQDHNYYYNNRSRIKYQVDQLQLLGENDDHEHQFNLYNFEEQDRGCEYPEFQEKKERKAFILNNLITDEYFFNFHESADELEN